MLNILVAPTSFKGSLTAVQAAEAIASHIPDNFKVITMPVADGGDGTLEILSNKLRGKFIKVETVDPLGKPINAEYFLTDDKIAIIELARTSGLNLIAVDACPAVYGSTRGTGKMILSALDQEITGIILSVGGSATADGGIGILKELGYRFYNRDGFEIRDGGIGLVDIHSIDDRGVDTRILKIPIQILCDVDNPLLGEKGGIEVYSPQKGASPEQIRLLIRGFKRLVEVIRKHRNWGIADLKYGGASGGVPAVLSAFLKTKLEPGAEFILKMLDFEKILKNTDLIVTGEGRIDETTSHQKIVSVIVNRAKKLNKLVLIFCGEISVSNFEEIVFSISPGGTDKGKLMTDAEKNLGLLTSRVFSLISRISMITSNGLR
jgi:glycerate 2-kinase